MATNSATFTVDNQTDLGFQTWVQGVITGLLAVGLTQTADTGQINTSTVTAPTAANTTQGYTIWSFNDTLQSTAPIFIKLEFGSGNGQYYPIMWITVGTGSDGAGNITFTGAGSPNNMGRCEFGSNQPPTTVGAFVTSQFCYNATYGTLYVGIGYNNNTAVGPTAAAMGFYVFRSNDNTGAPTGDAVMLYTNSYPGNNPYYNATAFLQSYSYLTGTQYPSGSGSNQTGTYGFYFYQTPFTLQGNVYAGDTQIWPCFYMTPRVSISAFFGVSQYNDIAIFATFSTALVGATALPLMQAGTLGNTYAGANNGQRTANDTGVCVIWA
jgi:hypothetical protein